MPWPGRQLEAFYGRATSAAEFAPLLSARHVLKLVHLDVELT